MKVSEHVQMELLPRIVKLLLSSIFFYLLLSSYACILNRLVAAYHGQSTLKIPAKLEELITILDQWRLAVQVIKSFRPTPSRWYRGKHIMVT